MITNFNTNFLSVWIFRVNCGQSGQTRNLMREESSKDSIYK